jgi:branched-subunit amino acid ABC-type transport system permease component
VLGGLGSVTGTIVAAYVVALIDVLVAAALPGIGRDVVAFGIVLIVLAVLPRGLLPGRDLRPA